jgi:phosphatidylglycerophosphate synthase
MSLFIYFSHTSPIKIWGLTSAERVERVLNGVTGKGRIEDLSSLQEADSVLILRGDYLFDDRLVKHLAATPNVIIRLEHERQQECAVAAHVPAHLARQALAVIEGSAPADTLPGVRIELPATISASFEQNLHKFEPPFVLPITAEKKPDLERRLFDWSYKGITDLVTKWAWPRPARWVVGHCVRLNIRPNHVTLLGLFLAILAGVFFAYGHFGWGLVAGWLMTFLDTVDGKLARVTVTSSKFGHYFDHIIDLVHPPIWYILWGLGLPAAQVSSQGFSLSTLFYLMMIGYIAGRFVEGSFKQFLGASFVIFSWRPIDSYFRLITARRNPCMIFLTMSYFIGRPELGLLAVVFWTVATSIFLLGRLMLAGYVRCTQGPLRSWLADADQPRYAKTLAVRWFTKYMAK